MMIAQGVNWTEVGTLGAIAVACIGALIFIAKHTVTSLSDSQQQFVKKLVDAALDNMKAATLAIDSNAKAVQTLATEVQRSSAVREERDKLVMEMLRDIKTEIRSRVRDIK